MTPRHSVQVTVYDSLLPRRVTVSGKRVIEMLERLIEVGQRGTTAAEFRAGTRVSDSIFKLRRAGIVISTEHEANHDGLGSHARYRLRHKVEIDAYRNLTAA